MTNNNNNMNKTTKSPSPSPSVLDDNNENDKTTTTVVTTPYPFARLSNPSTYEIFRVTISICTGFVFLRFVAFVSILCINVPMILMLHNLSEKKMISKSWSIYLLRFTCRSLLFVSGYLWIPCNYNKNFTTEERENTKHNNNCCPQIIVSNHISNMEILHLLSLPYYDNDNNPVAPAFITKESVFNIPLIGPITKDVLGSIGVKRSSTTKGTTDNNRTTTTTTTDLIVAKVRENNNGAPIIIFPEGTTTNGTSLLTFKKGAFVPMVKIQPVLYSFGDNNNDKVSFFLPTYDSIWAPAYIIRQFSQFYTPFTCKFLNTINPPLSSSSSSSTNYKGEKNVDLPSLFSQMVRKEMAKEGNLPCLSPKYNYQHKLIYHNKLRDVYCNRHPKGPIYAMIFEPMQKVFNDNDDDDDDDNNNNNNSKISFSSINDDVGYDVVIGTKFIKKKDEIDDDSKKEKKDQ